VPTNTFSLGRDCQLVVIAPTGRVDLTHVTGFDSRQITHPIRIDRLDGTQTERVNDFDTARVGI